MLVSKITLTSMMGSFVFGERVRLSQAKLIRDTITGQFFAPRPTEPKIKNEKDVERYVHNYMGNLGAIPFEVHINPMAE